MELTKDDKIYAMLTQKKDDNYEKYSIRYYNVRVIKTFKNGKSIVKYHEYRNDSEGNLYLYDLSQYKNKIDSDTIFDNIEEARIESKKMLIKLLEEK